jgi:hypothetical protein
MDYLSALGLGSGSGSTTGTLADYVDERAKSLGIPSELARALVRQESGGNPDAVSPKGARGATQVMPGTMREMGYDPTTASPKDYVDAGLGYLRKNYDQFGNWEHALAAYHAGPGAVAKAGGVPNTSDGLSTTADYVKNIMGRANLQGDESAPAARAPGVLDWLMSDQDHPDDSTERLRYFEGLASSRKAESTTERFKAGAQATLRALTLSKQAAEGASPQTLAETIANGVKSSLVQTDAAREMQANTAEAAKGYKDAKGPAETVGAFANLAARMGWEMLKHPHEAVNQILENLPNSAPGLVAGAGGAVAGGFAGPAGALAGSVAAGTAAGTAVEFGAELEQRAIKLAQENKVDPTDVNAMSKLIADHLPELQSKALAKGVTTAGTDAVISRITFGLGGMGERSVAKSARSLEASAKAGAIGAEEAAAELTKVRAAQAARNTFGAKLGRGAGETAGEMFGEGASEGLGRVATGDDFDAQDAINEGLMGFGTGLGMTLAGRARDKALGIAPVDHVETAIQETAAAVGKIQQAKTVGEAIAAATAAVGDVGAHSTGHLVPEAPAPVGEVAPASASETGATPAPTGESIALENARLAKLRDMADTAFKDQAAKNAKNGLPYKTEPKAQGDQVQWVDTTPHKDLAQARLALAKMREHAADFGVNGNDLVLAPHPEVPGATAVRVAPGREPATGRIVATATNPEPFTPQPVALPGQAPARTPPVSPQSSGQQGVDSMPQATPRAELEAKQVQVNQRRAEAGLAPAPGNDQTSPRLEQPEIKDTSPKWADETPMDEREAKNRLTILRDFLKNTGGDPESLGIVPHPTEAGKFAIRSLEQQTHLTPSMTGNRALAEDVGVAVREKPTIIDPVEAFVNVQRRTNTPAARRFVKDFEIGRITREDVQKLVDRETELAGQPTALTYQPDGSPAIVSSGETKARGESTARQGAIDRPAREVTEGPVKPEDKPPVAKGTETPPVKPEAPPAAPEKPASAPVKSLGEFKSRMPISKENDEIRRANYAGDFGALAKILASSPNPVVARVGELALKIKGKITLRKPGPLGHGALGVYRYDDSIQMAPEAAGDEWTNAHETVHALVSKAQRYPEGSQRILAQKIEALYKHVQRELRAKGKANFYGLTNVREFTAEAFSNQEFQYELMQIPYGKRTAWSSFVQFVADLLGIKDSNAFTEVLALTEKLAETRRRVAVGDKGLMDKLEATQEDRADSTPEAATEPAPEEKPGLRERAADIVMGAKMKNDIAEKVTSSIASVLLPKAAGEFNWFHRTLGTQFHKAMVNPAFKKVFDGVQRFINDIAIYAARAERLAPSIFPGSKVGLGVSGLGLRAEENKRVGRMLADGTLEIGLNPETKAEWTDAELLDTKRRKDGEVAINPKTGEAWTVEDIKDQMSSNPRLGRVWTDEELRQRYNASDREITAYREAREAIKQSLADVTKTQMGAIARVSGVKNSVVRALVEDPESSLDGVLAALSSMVDSPQAQGQLRDTALQAKTLMANGYSPLMRFGSWGVLARNADGEDVYFGMVDNKAQARELAKQLEQDPEIKSVQYGFINNERHKLFQGMTPETAELYAQITGADKEEGVQNHLRLAVDSRSIMKRMLKRQGMAGYSVDATRTLASFITGNARRSSTQVNLPDVNTAMRNPDLRGDIQREAQRLRDYVVNPQEEASKIRGLMFLQYLGGSIASGLINMTQPVMMTLPYLAQWGTRRAGTALAEGARDTIAFLTGKQVADATMSEALNAARDQGILDPAEMYQLMAAAQQGAGSFGMQRLVRLWGMNFQLTEAFNRTLTYAAAYRVGQRMTPAERAKATGAEESALVTPAEFAAHAISETQGLYNKGNRPNWARGAVGSTLFTFKQYSIHYVEFLKRLWGNNLMPKKGAVVALGMLMLMSGINGLPGADDLDDVLDSLGRLTGHATNSKRWKREVLTETLGFTDEMADLVLGGVAPAGVGSRLGVANIVPGTRVLDPAKTDKWKEIADVFGAPGSMAMNLMQTATALASGNVDQAAKLALPVALQNLYRGAEMAMTGEYRDMAGKKVLDADLVDAAGKAIGFQPSNVAERSRNLKEVQPDAELYNWKKMSFNQEYARAIRDRDPAARAEVQAQLNDWNRENPEMRINLDFGKIQGLVKQMRMGADERVIHGAPKALRREFAAALRG